MAFKLLRYLHRIMTVDVYQLKYGSNLIIIYCTFAYAYCKDVIAIIHEVPMNSITYY